MRGNGYFDDSPPAEFGETSSATSRTDHTLI